mmetsp:Transcript_68607/g.114622  ORF Transcript_68607/g.114622 Transcript_68607/m.114622 type:complete len:202 (+) Transcript_68607:1819-2424(+)
MEGVHTGVVAEHRRGTRDQKEVNNVQRAMEDGEMQWGLTIFVLSVQICTFVDEHLCTNDVAILDHNVQRGLTVVVANARVSLVGVQQLSDPCMISTFGGLKNFRGSQGFFVFVLLVFFRGHASLILLFFRFITIRTRSTFRIWSWDAWGCLCLRDNFHIITHVPTLLWLLTFIVRLLYNFHVFLFWRVAWLGHNFRVNLHI